MVLLNPREAIVKQATVHRINPQGTREGVLTLTNFRLVFEAHIPQGPLGGGVVRTTIDAPLGRIRNATLSKPALGRARLEIELPQQVGVFQTDDAEGWLQAILEARSTAPADPGGMGGSGGRPGPGGPRWGGGGGGAPAVVLRCRYCGTLNPPTATKCTSCGAPI